MARKRRRFTAEFKARVALEALRERDSVQAIAARRELHPNQVTTWKRQLLEGLPEVFAGGAGRKAALEHEAKIRDLHAKIGELTVERDFFSAGSSAEPGGAGADDRAGRTAESFEAVRAAGPAPDPAAHAPDGDGGDLPAAAHERGESGAPRPSCSTAARRARAGSPSPSRRTPGEAYREGAEVW